jgi:hypothetical protein
VLIEEAAVVDPDRACPDERLSGRRLITGDLLTGERQANEDP